MKEESAVNGSVCALCNKAFTDEAPAAVKEKAL